MLASVADYLGAVVASFTIAIPTHDRRETMLLSLGSALAQTQPPEQVLVLCDGCSDGSAEAVRELAVGRVEVLELPKLPGYAYAHRNLALELAHGEAIMWLGDDDLLLPDHLERLAERWREGAFDLVQAPAVAVWPDDSLSWVGLDWGVRAHAERLERANTNVMSAVCVRVAAARAAGGWDTRMDRAGDWDLWKRVLARGGAAMTDEPTVLHFRAAGREQAWAERVLQNTAWAQLLADPAALAALRPRLRALRPEREAQWLAEIDASAERVAELSRHLRDAGAEIERLTSAHEQRERALLEEASAVAAQLGRTGAELERLREVERTLARVYVGGWWRLRARLQPIRRLARRLLGRSA
jgi:hypothetical protein